MHHETETPEKLNNQVPFIIRAHHLPLFGYLIQRSRYRSQFFDVIPSLPPQEVAKNVRTGIEKSAVFKLNYYLKRNASLDEQERLRKVFAEYTHDVLGSSSESADRNEEYTRQTFETFLTLPESHPAEIAEGIPDVICKGCAIGEHCRRMYSLENGSENLRSDREYLTFFIDVMKNMSCFDIPRPTIIIEQAHFSDSKSPQRIRKVKTTMGVAKKVLAF